MDALALSGVWLPGTTFVPPAMIVGFRDPLALSGVWLPGTPGAPEAQPPAREFLTMWRRRRR